MLSRLKLLEPRTDNKVAGIFRISGQGFLKGNWGEFEHDYPKDISHFTIFFFCVTLTLIRWEALHSCFCYYVQGEIETLFILREMKYFVWLTERGLCHCDVTWLWQCWALSGLVIIAPSFWRQTTPRTAKKMEFTNFLFVWWNIESRTQRDSFIIVMIM